MYEVEDSYWWYVGMRSIFLSLLDGHYRERTDLKILDAGCGTGAMLSYLKPYGQVFGVDISSEAIRFATRRNVQGCELVQSSLTELPPLINRGLAQVLFLERRLLQKVDLPFGLSVVCVTRK